MTPSEFGDYAAHLRERIATLEALLRAVEWGGEGATWEEPGCPCCHEPQTLGHYDGCELATALLSVAHASPRLAGAREPGHDAVSQTS